MIEEDQRLVNSAHETVSLRLEVGKSATILFRMDAPRNEKKSAANGDSPKKSLNDGAPAHPYSDSHSDLSPLLPLYMDGDLSDL